MTAHLERACELLWQAGHPAVAEALASEVRELTAAHDRLHAVLWPAAATLAEPGEKRGGRLSAEHPRPSKSGSASAAVDEPAHDVSDPIWDEERDKYRVECSCGWEMSEWAEESARALARDHLAGAAADEPGETP